MFGLQSVGQVIGCAHCDFRCQWALGNRQAVEFRDHMLEKHPELWTKEDEKAFQDWMAT